MSTWAGGITRAFPECHSGLGDSQSPSLNRLCANFIGVTLDETSCLGVLILDSRVINTGDMLGAPYANSQQWNLETCLPLARFGCEKTHRLFSEGEWINL